MSYAILKDLSKTFPYWMQCKLCPVLTVILLYFQDPWDILLNFPFPNDSIVSEKVNLKNDYSCGSVHIYDPIEHVQIEPMYILKITSPYMLCHLIYNLYPWLMNCVVL